MQRFAIGIEYDGTDFFGWQRLRHGPTIQACVEAALSRVADRPVSVVCSGRTDSGVHARCQVAHFDTEAIRAPRAFVLGANSLLPATVALRWCVPVAIDFSARFAATSRRYQYCIINRQTRPALDARFVTWIREPLDVDAMHRASRALVGQHDFSAFRSVRCQAPHAVRTIHSLDLTRAGDALTLAIHGNAFLHHMVRNIVGSLLPIGRGEQSPAWLAEVLAGRDRSMAGPTAPATGLTYLGPQYDAAHGLPDRH